MRFLGKQSDALLSAFFVNYILIFGSILSSSNESQIRKLSGQNGWNIFYRFTLYYIYIYIYDLDLRYTFTDCVSIFQSPVWLNCSGSAKCPEPKKSLDAEMCQPRYLILSYHFVSTDPCVRYIAASVAKWFRFVISVLCRMSCVWNPGKQMNVLAG